ncbi:30S ribosomal protein S5 [Candidatus Falkowbacteria bacterium]|nr:30S ribosomal protein S5 [Candidatus Falkowbacteria bacterium]
MAEEQKDNLKEVAEKPVDTDKKAAVTVAKSVYGEKKKTARAGRSGRKGGGRREKREEEFEQRIIDLARVTRVMAGGKRMRFRACVAIGNKKGRVAIGMAKGADVTLAVTKAVNKAKKNFIEVPIVNDTVPHEIYHKFGAAKVLLKPARSGRGVIAGGAVRIILELAGIKNVTSKILGTNNKVNNVKCVIEALKSLKRVEDKKSEIQNPKSETNSNVQN